MRTPTRNFRPAGAIRAFSISGACDGILSDLMAAYGQPAKPAAVGHWVARPPGLPGSGTG